MKDAGRPPEDGLQDYSSTRISFSQYPTMSIAVMAHCSGRPIIDVFAIQVRQRALVVAAGANVYQFGRFETADGF